MAAFMAVDFSNVVCSFIPQYCFFSGAMREHLRRSNSKSIYVAYIVSYGPKLPDFDERFSVDRYDLTPAPFQMSEGIYEIVFCSPSSLSWSAAMGMYFYLE